VSLETEFNIREATLKDVSAISVLGRNTYREHFADIWHDIDSFLNADFSNDAIKSCINSPSSHRYLLAQQIRVAGCVKKQRASPKILSTTSI